MNKAYRAEIEAAALNVEWARVARLEAAFYLLSVAR